MVIKTNKEKRTVVAIIPNIQKQMRLTIRKVNPNLSWMDEVDSIINKMPNSCNGIAKCSPTDMWNEQTGIDIARARAILTHAKLRARTLRKIAHFIHSEMYTKTVSKYIDALDTVYDYGDIGDILEAGTDQ